MKITLYFATLLAFLILPSIAHAQTAVCRDGSTSYSQHRSGTCSHHGGVYCWYGPAGTTAPSCSVTRSAVVVKRVEGCDYYMVDEPSGYAILEWFGGYDPDTGDTITGNFDSYGFKDLVVDGSWNTRVWVSDYWLTREEAEDRLADKCSE